MKKDNLQKEWNDIKMTIHSSLILYLVIINVITFVIFGVDKYKAIRQEWRIRESTLLGLALIGGSIGGWLAMYIFHHKTKKVKFFMGIPVILAIQIVVFSYLFCGGDIWR